MPETVTTFTCGGEESRIERPRRVHARDFKDVEGKQYKTFDDELTAKGERLMGRRSPSTSP